MNKSEIITIIMQEAEIKRLTDRNKKLETGCKDLFDENARLRGVINKVPSGSLVNVNT